MNRSIFNVRKIEEPTLGNYLINKRKKLNLSLGSAAERLTISQAHLKALEKDDFSSLPPEVYTKGVIRRYCDLLGLEKDKAIFLYEKNKARPRLVLFPHTRLTFVRLQKLFNYRNFIIFSAFLLIFLLCVYLARVILPLYQKPAISIDDPAKCPFETREDSINISGKSQPESKIWLNGEEIILNKEGYFECPIFLKEGENVVQLRAVNKFGREGEENCVIRKGN